MGQVRVAIFSVLFVLGPGLGPGLAVAGERSGATLVVDGFDVRGLAGSGPVRIAEFPIKQGLAVDLELEPFSVTGAGTRFVLGRKGRSDVELDFDPRAVTLLRGRVAGRPGSSVFLAVADGKTTGHIDLGDSGAPYRLSSSGEDGLELAGGQVAVFQATAPASLPPDVPMCGVEEQPAEDALPAAPAALPSTLTPGLEELEFAIETDHEFFQLFGDADAASTYLVMLVAAMSDIYIRDVDVRIELSFVRLWDQPDDLFNDVDPSPLSDFRNYWNANMGSVTRDSAMLISGRRDYPFGGQAYLNSLCGGSGYGVVGYILGYFPDPTQPSAYHHDLYVTAHELGHNAGTGHSHDNGIDTCQNTSGSPQRGTIMSYCGQTWSGGRSNADMYFHAIVQQNIEAHVATRTCLAADCNRNGVDDATDITWVSLDANSNGIPDECEDCNDNAVLDDVDIAGASQDLNNNGVPDECEPDCDGDAIPDDKEIDDGTSTDAYGNDIPDECEPDCNANSVSDYTEIQGDMTLDIDRDRVPDACQDCDGDGTVDLDELQGAHAAWVASGLDGSVVRRFLESTGVKSSTSTGVTVREGQDVVVTDSGRVLVTSALDDRVLEYDVSGAYVQDLITAGAGGLDYPTGLVMHGDGTLLVASRDTDSVLAYDGANGTPLGAFVTPGSGGLTAPFGLTFGPAGNLFVTSGTNEVLQYDGTTGAFAGFFVAAASNGGLDQPRGLVFKPDGNLLVASFGTDEVLEFEASSGVPMGKWARVGTATRLTQDSPWGVRVGPNGNVFVVRTGESYSSGGSRLEEEHEHLDEAAAERLDKAVAQLHLTNAQIYEYDVRNGNFLRTFIGGNDHGMLFPSGFDFVPGWGIDCNLNGLQDDCDIASGFSVDADLSGVPDDCEIDCNANGVIDRRDIVPFGSSLDCNFNLLPDECDIASGASFDCDGNGVPDECEITHDFETASGWTAGVAGDTAGAGFWERVDPNGTAAQPEDDRTPGSGTQCFVTGQGAPGGADGAADVDGGTTTLLSPAFDLASDPDAEIGYWRWYSNDAGANPAQDVFTVDVSNDGQSWVNVETVGPDGPGNSGLWTYRRFRVADFVAPNATVQLRFVAEDAGGGSVVEAAVDDVSIFAACPCVDDAMEITSVIVDDVSPTRVSWPTQPGLVYDVAGGDIATMQADGDTDAASCLEDDHPSSSWDDQRPDPAAGAGYYYLVRSQKICSTGTYGFATGGQERIPVACP